MSPAAGQAWLLAIDTATTSIVAWAGRPDGTPIAGTTWVAGYRHGQTLLPAVDGLAREAGLATADLAAVVVGTGPGAFTGLRVGLATAKGLCHALGVPIVGVSTGEALLVAAREAAGGPAGATFALLLPAGPSDRVLVVSGEPPRLLTGGADPELGAGTIVAAVDLDGRATDDALARGRAAVERLGPVFVRLGAARLGAGDVDDLARLVPDYVSLPRGVRSMRGEVSWSHDPR